MTDHVEAYRAHRITVSVLPQAEGGFAWAYSVDGGDATRSRSRPARSAALAIANALGHAKAQIDAFIWTETRAS